MFSVVELDPPTVSINTDAHPELKLAKGDTLETSMEGDDAAKKSYKQFSGKKVGNWYRKVQIDIW